MRAAAKGWAFTYDNRDKAVELLVKHFPNLVAADERAAVDVMLDATFTAATKTGGFGTMDPAIWQDQISLYSQLGQFTKRTPIGRGGDDARYPERHRRHPPEDRLMSETATLSRHCHRVPGCHGAVLQRSRLGHRVGERFGDLGRRRLPDAAGPVRLRQINVAACDRRYRSAGGGQCQRARPDTRESPPRPANRFRVSGLCLAAVAQRARQRAPAPGSRRQAITFPPALLGRKNCCIWSVWPAGKRPCRTNCPVACANVWRSPAPCLAGREYC